MGLTPAQIENALSNTAISRDAISAAILGAEIAMKPLHLERDKYKRDKDPQWKEWDDKIVPLRTLCIYLHYVGIGINIRKITNEKTSRSSTSNS